MIISNIGGKLMSRTNRKEYEDWKGFGERTKRSRESLGLTREKFAEMIDRTENYTLSLEKGDKVIITGGYPFKKVKHIQQCLLLTKNKNIYKKWKNS